MIRKFYLLLGVLCFLSCEELIEVEDISDENISILAPANNTTLDGSAVSFSWEPLEHAESYHLQIARPEFNNAQVIVEDTMITATNFIKDLEAASYQWRVRAINFNYQTQYTTLNLTIEE
ncbi:hypothetical protein [uncultured Winogradskyella sp.]|uniref:hypothetical protein n=1 Tax=uncultured Winogradskyella sp. TaxID=395353 RepID=UPI0026121046|nr:hypothetical protein [uncultured Winogradskyella sp.]